jgi:hypothetical protein
VGIRSPAAAEAKVLSSFLWFGVREVVFQSGGFDLRNLGRRSRLLGKSDMRLSLSVTKTLLVATSRNTWRRVAFSGAFAGPYLKRNALGVRELPDEYLRRRSGATWS